MTRVRRAAAGVALGVALVLVIEGTTSLGLAARDAGRVPRPLETSHCRPDPDLGWSNVPSLRIPDLYGPGRHYTTTARGFRGRTDVDDAVPDGRFRVVCLGDSFTMGYGVDDTETYPAHLERLEPRLQVVNMGLGGYGLGQCYSWYLRDGVALETDVLLFAFIEDDFLRIVLDDFMGYPKPRWIVRDGALELTGVPVPAAWGQRQRQWLATWIHETALGRALLGGRPAVFGQEQTREIVQVAHGLLDRLHELCEARGQRLVLAYLPDRLRSFGGQRSLVRRWVESYATEADVPFIDLTPAFAALPPDRLLEAFPHEGHYAGWANARVAQTLLDALREHFDDVPR